jgi:hypothetical protein
MREGRTDVAKADVHQDRCLVGEDYDESGLFLGCVSVREANGRLPPYRGRFRAPGAAKELR